MPIRLHVSMAPIMSEEPPSTPRLLRTWRRVIGARLMRALPGRWTEVRNVQREAWVATGLATTLRAPACSAPMNGPVWRSHFVPRTRDGRVATIAFVLVFLLAMPPVTHTLLNRTEPWILGMPFLFAALLAIYVALIGILVWAYRRGV